ncbi:MAG: AAA family ATPase [Deltaproteobacteria bacterium]|nr:AAA family ATPase [Deltaproteobacteria bacterium]
MSVDGRRSVFNPGTTVVAHLSDILDRPTTDRDVRDRGAHKADHQVIVLFSAKGGCGSTSLAVNVAQALAKGKRAVCVLDMDLQVGGVRSALGLRRVTTVAQALKWTEEGTPCTPALLARHESGVAAIAQAGTVEELDTIVPEKLPKLVANLRKSFTTIIVDGVRDFSETTLAILDAADTVAVVAVPEVLAIRNAKWIFEILRRIGYSPDELALIVNRHATWVATYVEATRKLFLPTPTHTVPFDAEIVTESLDRGILLDDLDPHRHVTRGIARLAWTLVGEERPGDLAALDKEPTSFWARVLKGG